MTPIQQRRVDALRTKRGYNVHSFEVELIGKRAMVCRRVYLKYPDLNTYEIWIVGPRGACKRTAHTYSY